MKNLVEFLVKPYLEHPADLSINVVEGSASTLLEVRVNESDYERVRGPEGANFQAIQQVVAASGGSVKPVVDLIEPGSASLEE